MRTAPFLFQYTICILYTHGRDYFVTTEGGSSLVRSRFPREKGKESLREFIISVNHQAPLDQFESYGVKARN